MGSDQLNPVSKTLLFEKIIDRISQKMTVSRVKQEIFPAEIRSTEDRLSFHPAE